MDISISKKDVMDSLEREISRAAAGSYAADGTSLYDGLRITSRDSEVMTALMDEALAVLLSALHRFMNAHVTANTLNISLTLEMSERRARAKIDIVPPLVIAFLVKVIISKYFSEKQNQEQAERFDKFAAADMLTLQKSLFEKSAPKFKVTENEDGNDNNQ